MKGKSLIALVAAVQFAGCAAKTTPPKTALERAPLSQWDTSVVSDQAYDPKWWKQFDDPVLESLETAAVEANRDVRSAIARLDQARAVFEEDKRLGYPKVTAGASVDGREQVVPGFTNEAVRTNTYRAGFDASNSPRGIT